MTELAQWPVPFALARLDAGRRIVEVNTAWGQLFGEGSATCLGRSFDGLISPRDPAGQRAYMRGQATRPVGGFSFHARVETLAGGILLYLRFQLAGAGWLVLAEEIRSDGTLADLLFERQRLRSVLHGASEGIAVLDEHGRFLEVNARFLELVMPRAAGGALLDDQGIVGWSCQEVMPPVVREALEAPLAAEPRRRAFAGRVILDDHHLDLKLTSTTLSGGFFAGTCLVVYDRTADVRLQEANRKLASNLEFMEELYRVLPGLLIVFDAHGVVTKVNGTTCTVLGYDSRELIGRDVASLFDPADAISVTQLGTEGSLRGERKLVPRSGETIPVLVAASVCRPAGGSTSSSPPAEADSDLSVVCMALDIRDRKRLEMELRQAQKLESVGRMAAGVAHEINTPVQFVNDSVYFLRDAIGDFIQVIEAHQQARLAEASGGHAAAVAAAAAAAIEDAADLDYLFINAPKALERCLDGLGRVATIVRSMKEFAHPDAREMTTVDLNRAIASTLTIASNEYKYVADIETEFGDLPMVACFAGEINQVILNIIVNAAHAIGDVVSANEPRGRITVKTEHVDEHVVIAISDTGGGIPTQVRDKIFDPFFTTKAVGKGTGQGLAIARSIIEKHRGVLAFHCDEGKGTTFSIRLPIDAAGVQATTST